MKKFLYLLAGAMVASAMSSCEDDKEPVYKAPTTFEVNTPTMQDQYLATTANMDDQSTFQLVCKSQPDYGYSAVADYNAQVSLTNDFSEGKYVTLENQDVHNSVMRLRTYDLACAICSLLGINDEDDWAAYEAAGGALEIPVYFKATCELAGVAGSFIASSNTVAYNKVQVQFSVKRAGYIFVVGKLYGFDEAGEKGYIDFTTPTADNRAHLMKYARLIEPVIGSKVYAGTFIVPKVDNVEAALGNPDDQMQWRFFTDLKGWDDLTVQVGSNVANFYVEPITALFKDGLYEHDAVYGQGNWGVAYAADTYMTMVVDLQNVTAPKVYFKEGNWSVGLDQNSAGLWVPAFSPAD